MYPQSYSLTIPVVFCPVTPLFSLSAGDLNSLLRFDLGDNVRDIIVVVGRKIIGGIVVKICSKLRDIKN